MTMLLKQSTAATVLVGPVLDSSGLVYTGMAIGDFSLTKNGTVAAMAASATATHDHNGMYLIALTTGNTDTLGRLVISCNKSTYAMSAFTFEVLTASTFDAIVTNAATAAGGLQDIQRMAGTALTGRDLGLITANTIAHLNQIYDTDYATVYDTTNKAFLSKLGNFTMGGSSLALTTGAVSITTLTTSGTTTLNALTVTNATTLSGAVSFGSTWGVTGAITFPASFAFSTTQLASLNNATPSLSVAALAAILQGVHKCANVYFVSTTGNDSSAGGVSAPFLTVNHAASVAGAADGIIILSGSYTNTGTITFLGKVWGESRGSVILNCSLANDTAIVLGNGADLHDFTIKSTVSGADFGLTINLTSGGTSSLTNMHLIGVTDVFYLNGVTGATLNVESCLIFTPWDWLNGEHSSSNKAFISNSIIRVIGPVVTSGTTFPTASTGMYASSMKIVFKNTTIDVTTTDAQALIANVIADGSDVVFDNSPTRTLGGGTMIDYQTSNGGKFTLKNMAYDPSKLNLESASDLTVIAPLQSSTLNKTLSVSSTGKAAATVATGDMTDLPAVRAAKIDNLDAAVSTRLPTSSYTAPDNTGTAAAAASAATAATQAGAANAKLPSDPASETNATSNKAALLTAIGGIEADLGDITIQEQDVSIT